MLNRSLFEDMIDTHWVATDEEGAEYCHADHLEHGHMLLAGAVAKYPEYYAEIELPDFDPEERKRLDDDYGKFGHKSWTKVNLHERVLLVEHHWTDEVRRSTLHFFHDIAHRENNQTLHVSSATLGKNLEFHDGELGLTVGPRNDPCPCGSGIKFKRCHGS